MAEDNWRELLDDPEVETIIRKVVRIEGSRMYRHPNDAMLLDDLESYLWDASVRVAEKAPHQPGDDGFYGWLYQGLRYATEHHRSKVNGEYGSARQQGTARPAVSLDAEAQRVAETGHSRALFSRRLTYGDPLAFLIRLEDLAEAVARAERRSREGGNYRTETTCREALCASPVVTAGLCGSHYTRYRQAWVSGACSVDGCTKGVQARGLCPAHYFHASKANAEAWAAERATPKLCSVPGCHRKHKGMGLCRMHLDRQRKHGSTER